MKLPSIFLLLLCSVFQMTAETQSFTFSFNESDFTITQADNDSLNILSSTIPILLPDESEPCIPSISKRIAIGNHESISEYTVSFNKRLLRTGVKLNNAPQVLPTNVPVSEFPKQRGGYDSKIYPDSNCVIAGSYNFAGFNVINFKVCPFQYDDVTGNLYFIDSMTLNVEIAPSRRNMAPSRGVRPDQLEMLRSYIENKDAIDNMSMPMAVSSNNDAELIEYVIITSEELKSTFQPLAEWKRKKGVRSKIITIEEIEQNYSGEALQMKIKTCLMDMYRENFLRFVLLGGDVQIVPTQPCYVNSFIYEKGSNTKFIISEDIPADVYYSTLGEVNWDTNNDGRFGEPKSDRVDIVPQLYVTRAPVRNISETKIFVDRIIEYEQSPNFNVEFLQAGTYLRDDVTGESVADMIFRETVEYKLVLGRQKFFDTCTPSGQQFNEDNFLSELRKGYQFVEVFSHGLYDRMVSDEKPRERPLRVLFTREKASTLMNSGHSLFTTTACLTNAFDQYETTYSSNPCISEALIRNPQSGIIGYLGSSRYGWFNGTHTLTFSFGYEYDFYNRLLHDTEMPTIKHFGALINFMKHSYMNAADDEVLQCYLYRWLHYSINGIGDPETPIYNTYPRTNTIAYIDTTEVGKLYVNAGFDDALICVSSKNGNRFYETYNGEHTFETGLGTFDVWITKQNYIPLHFEARVLGKNLEPIFDDDKNKIREIKIEYITPNPASTSITIKYQTRLKNSEAILSLTSVNNGYEYRFDLTGDGSEEIIDISRLNNGIYIAKILADGEESINFVRLIKE